MHIIWNVGKCVYDAGGKRNSENIEVKLGTDDMIYVCGGKKELTLRIEILWFSQIDSNYMFFERVSKVTFEMRVGCMSDLFRYS